jgi:hypothetical protein
MALSALPIGRWSSAAWRCLAASSVLACLVLGGCGGAPPTDTPAIKAAGERMRSLREECQQRRRSGALASVTEVERCAAPGVIAAYQEADYPYMDLLRFAEAARLAGAQKVDRGEIGASEYERQRLRLRDRLAAEIDRRNAETPPRRFPETPDPSTTARLVAGLSAFDALGR